MFHVDPDGVPALAHLHDQGVGLREAVLATAGPPSPSRRSSHCRSGHGQFNHASLPSASPRPSPLWCRSVFIGSVVLLLRRSKSPSGKYLPLRSFGALSSTVPARVSQGLVL